jgi:aryl-alcohol dehydrogenase
MKIKAAVAVAPEKPLEITELDLDEPRDGEVRVRMVASGVCHTDAIIRDQWYPTPLPAVLGHEGAGVVEALGAGVTGFALGDPVLMSFNHCGRCANCAGGRPGYCADFYARNFGGRRPDGSSAFRAGGAVVSSHFFGQSSFASHANVPVASLVTVPAIAPLEVLAPLGCGIQTGAGAVLNSLNPPAGATITVFGAGAVGLSAVLAARIAACTTIIAVDRHRTRLELARELGATHVVHAGTEDVPTRIREITKGGTQYALETTGVPEVFTAMTESLAVLGVGGVVGAAALGTTAAFPIGNLLPVGVTVKMIVEGDSLPSSFIPRLIALREAGLFPFDQLVRSYPFEQINDAFEDSVRGDTIKPVIVF